MQMHRALCFHYHDTGLRADGEWMSLTEPSVDSETLFSQEWTWMCGGRNGANIRELWESSFADAMMSVGAGVALGPYQPASASQLPSIGAYSDGSSPLFDGGVYEIIIKREAANFGNMFRTVAQASGGMRANNSAPVWLTGADGQQHAGAPSTVKVQPGAYIVADQTIWVPERLQADPTVSGECYGMVASSPDWTAIPANSSPLTWSEGSASSYVFWENATTNQCVRANNPDSVPAPAPPPQVACGRPPTLAAGTRHTFLNCFNQTDLLMRIYADGTLFATSAAPIPLQYIPQLDWFNSTFGPDYTTAALNLKIHRVFACRTPDPSTCR
jgi:hypothetical protein